MITMQAPKGVTQVSVEQQEFTVSENGTIHVPEPFVETLRDIGFRVIPARIVVSPEAAAAIAAAAAKLNLPVPAEVVVIDQATREANLAKVREMGAGVQDAVGDRINGSPREVVEAAAIEDPVKRAEALAALKAKDSATNTTQTTSTEPASAAPGAKVPEPTVGATGNQPTMSQKQMAEQNF